LDEFIQLVLGFTLEDKAFLQVTAFGDAACKKILPCVELKGLDIFEGLAYLVGARVFGLAYLIPGRVTPLASAEVETHLAGDKQPGHKASISN